jgi:hypothetical protein
MMKTMDTVKANIKTIGSCPKNWGHLKKLGPSKRKSRSARYRAMDKKLSKPVGRYMYGFRKCIIESVFGQMKNCHGFRGFLLRGLEKVRGEFSLWCIAHNILKLFKYGKKAQVIAG